MIWTVLALAACIVAFAAFGLMWLMLTELDVADRRDRDGSL
jgi:hypothetical protein